jgi:hypothetical protein
MSAKKKDKDLAHATNVWEREQLHVAGLLGEIEKSASIIDGHRNELTDEEYLSLVDKIDERRAEVAEYLLKSRDKYVQKCHDLGVEPTLPTEEAHA